MRPAQLFAVVSYLLTLAHAYLVFKHAPTLLPMQFDFDGRPTWSAAPQTFFIWQLAFLSFMNSVTIGISFVVRRIPISAINIPWKNYWMSEPERRDSCLSLVIDMLSMTAVFINFIAILAQSMIGQRAGISGFFIPIAISLNAFLTTTFIGTILFLLAVFLTFRPK